MNVQEDLLRKTIDPFVNRHSLEQLCGAPVSAIEALSGGCWNRVLLVHLQDGSSLVVKISPHAQDSALQREGAVLGYFAKHTRLPVPQLINSDPSGTVITGTVLVMSRMPGTVLHSALRRIGAADFDGVQVQLADYLAELHQISEPGHGSCVLPASEREKAWSAVFLEDYATVLGLARQSGLFGTDQLEALQQAAQVAPHCMDIGLNGCLMHYDVWAGNVMVQPVDGSLHISGFLDVQGKFGDRAREIAFMEVFGLTGPVFERRYFAVHPKDEGWDLRAAFYRLRTHVKHVTMYPGEWYYRQGVEENLSLFRTAAKF